MYSHHVWTSSFISVYQSLVRRISDRVYPHNQLMIEEWKWMHSFIKPDKRVLLIRFSITNTWNGGLTLSANPNLHVFLFLKVVTFKPIYLSFRMRPIQRLWVWTDPRPWSRGYFPYISVYWHQLYPWPQHWDQTSPRPPRHLSTTLPTCQPCDFGWRPRLATDCFCVCAIQ